MPSLLEEKFTVGKFDRKKKAFFDRFDWDFMPFAQKDPLPEPELLVPRQVENVQELIDLVKEGDLVSFIVSEIGMGKTALCRFLERTLPEEEDQKIVSVFLHGPSIENREQMLRIILERLELQSDKGDVASQFERLRQWHEDYPDFLLAVIVDEFPDIDEVVKMTLDCGALPSGCWLDGTSEGEADPMRHFKFLKDKGIPTLTIIPDRNWDIDDPEQKQLKLDNLEAAVKAGQELEMPILVGTEMNKHGQKFVDEFSTPELSPYRDIFLDGAHVAWGHTLLKMTAGMGYTGEWADEQFGSDTAARNEFFRKLGEGEYPEFHVFQELSELDEDADAEQIMQIAKG